MRRFLTCGCCGGGFERWPTYRDQDQDDGYGICRDCQADELRRARGMEREAFGLLRAALNPTNQAKWDAAPLWKKRVLVAKAFEDGHLTWRISRETTSIQA